MESGKAAVEWQLLRLRRARVVTKHSEAMAVREYMRRRGDELKEINDYIDSLRATIVRLQLSIEAIEAE